VGQSEEQFLAELRQASEPSVKADLALRAVADAERLDLSDDELESELDRMAVSYQMKPAELRRNLERNDQMPAVRSDLRKNKALEWLVEHVEIVDAEGHPVDRAQLTLEVDQPSEAPELSEAPETTEPTAVTAASESGEA
jgi:trigger factor